MNYCRNCGAKLEDKDKFCKKCGTKIIKKEESSNLNSDKKNDLEESTLSIDSREVMEKLKGDKKQEVPEKKDKQILEQDKIDNLEDDDNDSLDEEADEISNVGIGKKKILIFTVVIVLVLSAVIGVIFKDSIVCEHYLKKADKEISETEKVRNYNLALGYKYKDEILNEIYETIKNTDDFEEKIEQAYKLKEKDKNNILVKTLTYKAKESFNKENYEKCYKLLEKAKKKGYDINKFSNYNELLGKLKEINSQQGESNVLNQYTYKNSNPTIGDSYINSLGDVYYKNHNEYNNFQGYIIPESNTRYLTADELSNYDKYTLDLIRNEIFARYGYVFKEEPFKTYFKNKNWYSPNDNFKGNESDLNDYEKKNVKLLLELAKNK